MVLPCRRLALLSLALLNACGGNTAADAGLTFAGDNNQRLLTSTPFGAATATSAELRRPIAVQSTGTSAVEFSDAFALRTSPTDTTGAYFVVTAKNAGKDPLCFLKVGGLEYLTSSGVQVAARSLIYVTGSVGDMGHDIYTSSCLAPGESGYVLDVANVAGVFETVATVKIASVEGKPPRAEPAMRLRPTAYAWAASTATLTVTVVNEGTQPGAFGTLNRFVAFDAAGVPVAWAFFGLNAGKTLAPGETVDLTGAVTGKWGAMAVRPMLEFGAPGGVISLTGAPTRGEDSDEAQLEAFSAEELRRAASLPGR